MGASVDEPLLQAVKIAAEAKRTNVAVRRREKCEYIVDRSQAMSKMDLTSGFNATGNRCCERSYG